MKYKASEVKAILNISTDTLRFYEKKGIISPHIDETNNYRYYDDWDINYLLEYKYFRSFDFNVNDTYKLLHDSSLEDKLSIFKEKKKEIVRKRLYYSYLEEKINNYVNVMEKIEMDLYKCILTYSPECYYYTYRSNFSFKKASESNGFFDLVMKNYAFFDNNFFIREKTIQDDTKNNFEWGFSIKKIWFDRLGLVKKEPLQLLKSKLSIYTVIDAKERWNFSYRLLDFVWEYMKEHHYELDGDVFGTLLARTHEDRGYARYMEVWIPVKEKVE